ncbi:MAG: SHOCT domain-containing protein [Limisphaerales bacterium]
MKTKFVTILACFLAITLLTGCLSLHFEGGRKTCSTNTDEHPAVGEATNSPTLGQQLIDLQKAKDSGAITDAEYQAQKAKLLGNK